MAFESHDFFRSPRETEVMFWHVFSCRSRVATLPLSSSHSSRAHLECTMRACSIHATVPAPRVRGSPRTTGARPSPFATPTPVRGRRAAVSFAKRAAPRLEGLAEPEPDPALPAERALADGKHVLVAVDAKGARVYRTLLSSDVTRPPERLVPLIRYNDASKHELKKKKAIRQRRGGTKRLPLSPTRSPAPFSRSSPRSTPTPCSSPRTAKARATPLARSCRS